MLRTPAAMIRDDLSEIVAAIDPVQCTRDQWIQVGMVLKDAGHDVGEFDRWSQRDPNRYHSGEPERKWDSFRGSSTPVSTGTVVHIARSQGWRPAEDEGYELDWDSILDSCYSNGADEWDEDLPDDACDEDPYDGEDGDLVIRIINPSRIFLSDDSDAPCDTRAAQNPPCEHESPRITHAQPVGILMSDVVAERVEWLWRGRLPLGMLSVLDGDPGLGKSTVTIDLAARVSTGTAFPGEVERRAPQGVVLLSAEDDLAATVRPRLDAAGADSSRIVALRFVPDGDEERPPVLPDDIEWLHAAIKRVDAALVVVDPLMAFLSDDTDSHKDQSVRKMLHRLVILAEETGAAILIVRHLNKTSGGNPLYRGGGSIGIVGAARSGLLVGKDPDDETRRVLASTKCNLAAEPDSLSFHLNTQGEASRVVWGGTSHYSASALLSEPKPAKEEDHATLDECMNFLRDALSLGRVPSKDIHRMAREADFTLGTLKRAKKALGIKSVQEEFHGGFFWFMPGTVAQAHLSLDSVPL